MGNQPRSQQNNSPSNKELEKIALSLNQETDLVNYDDYCEKIKTYMEKNKRKLTSTQLRNIFNRVRKMKEPIELKKLRPILVYFGARNNIEFFTNLLEEIIKKVNDKATLESFKEFLKIAVAYRKAVDKN